MKSIKLVEWGRNKSSLARFTKSNELPHALLEERVEEINMVQ